MNKIPNESLEFNQCQQAVQRLNDFLSNELQQEEEILVQNHLKDCQGCLEKFNFEITLLRTLREKIGQVQAPDGLRQRILGLLHKTN
ncbi:zf-HC2 domain-containing protein [Armatimonas sp.]|uniref:zf-HC2 domain-containing protein n=1 Tax=Armatimonas sp. TaxID=1872638 RepID=UPI00286A8F92|nr:zf-HC2 domain-containing protein [Armatimonas sp.]